MAVTDGQPVSAAVTNAAYLSRNTDSDTTGILSLNNGLPASGAAIPNVQAAINALGGGIPNTTVSTQTVTTTIALASQSYEWFLRVDITGGGNLNNAPFGTDPTNFVDGMRLFVRGVSGVNTVGITNNDIQYGCLLNGDITLGDGDILQLIYDSTSERFIEVTRNA